jgi:hypothetical protein
LVHPNSLQFQIEEFFATNYSAYVPGHETRLSKMLEVLVSDKDGGSILKPELWQEVDELNEFLVQKLVVTKGDKHIR